MMMITVSLWLSAVNDAIAIRTKGTRERAERTTRRRRRRRRRRRA